MEKNFVAWNVECVDRVKDFETLAEAQAYADKMNEHWRMFTHDDDAVRFACGTFDEWNAVHDVWVQDVQRREAAQRAEEDQAFASHIDHLIANMQAEREALEALKPICKKFDNKVLNKRFGDAVKEAIGYNVTLGEAYGPKLRLTKWGYYGHNDSRISFYENEGWTWITGMRLEADKAIEAIDMKLEYYAKKEAQLLPQKSMMRDYINQVNKLAAQIKALYDNTPSELRQYVQSNHLATRISEAQFLA